jgi:thiol-disulfide isomerase/thioredoxin
LKNKVILISIWATWCGPCQGELPQVQKIFDRVKDRRDILVLTLNEDDDPGLIQPFLESHHYTFPVLPARDLVNAMVPGGSIPRNWLVDRSGVLKSAVVGFYLAYGVEWTDRTLKSLEQLTAESIQR